MCNHHALEIKSLTPPPRPLHLKLFRQQVLILISLLRQILPEGFICITKPTMIDHQASLDATQGRKCKEAMIPSQEASFC